MSSLYDLNLAQTEFRAEGMHHAQAIQMAVAKAVRQALEDCPLVEEIVHGPYVRMSASPKNFAPSKREDT